MGHVTRSWLGLVLVCLSSVHAGVSSYAEETKEPPMVMTVLEARVAADRLGDVERVFREGTSFVPPELVETYLVRDTKDPSLFRLTTVWRSMADLQKMRQSGEKPKGVQMFEAVGVTPTLSIFEVVLHRSN